MLPLRGLSVRLYVMYVCMSSVTLAHPAKATRWNKMPFGSDTRIIASNTVLDRGSSPPMGREDLGVETPPHPTPHPSVQRCRRLPNYFFWFSEIRHQFRSVKYLSRDDATTRFLKNIWHAMTLPLAALVKTWEAVLISITCLLMTQKSTDTSALWT